MFFTMYVQIAGADADERAANTKVAGDWLKSTFGLDAERHSYGLAVRFTGASIPEARAKATPIAGRLAQQDNVGAISQNDPVSNAGLGVADPWPGAMDEVKLVRPAARRPGVVDGRVTPQASYVRTTSAVDWGEWGSLTPSMVKVVAALVVADTPLLRFELERRAEVSRTIVQGVLSPAARNGLVSLTKEGTSAGLYQITDQGREAAAPFLPSTAKDEL